MLCGVRSKGLSTPGFLPLENRTLFSPDQGCQHYGFFHRSAEFRKWSTFLQIFIQSFEIFGFCADFAIFWFFPTFFIVIGNHRRFRPWSSWTANSNKKYVRWYGTPPPGLFKATRGVSEGDTAGLGTYPLWGELTVLRRKRYARYYAMVTNGYCYVSILLNDYSYCVMFYD